MLEAVGNAVKNLPSQVPTKDGSIGHSDDQLACLEGLAHAVALTACPPLIWPAEPQLGRSMGMDVSESAGCLLNATRASPPVMSIPSVHMQNL